MRLTFTEAIAPVDLVNPKRFRLSIGVYYQNDYYGYSRTSYQSPEFFNQSQNCYEKCYYYECYEVCYDGPLLELDILDILADAQDPAALVLLLENPVQPRLCEVVGILEDQPNGFGGLLLHYADGGAAQITDLVGLPLAPTGATWVKQSGQSSMQVDDLQFPEQNPFLPIPCPF